MTAYAELRITSNFSFLRGASHPEELVEQAKALGLAAISLTDRNSFAGIVRAHVAAKAAEIRFLVGCRLDLVDAPPLLAWPTDRAAYAQLSSLLTQGKRRAGKGACTLHLADVEAHQEGLLFAFLPPETLDPQTEEQFSALASRWPGRLWLALDHLYRGDDALRLERLADLGRRAGVPLLATNDVHYHVPDRRPLQDVVTCIREHCRVTDAGSRLFAHAERHLKPPAEMARLFHAYPEALAASLEIVERCRFSLDELAYDYPAADGYDGRTPDEELARRAEEGMAWRYPDHRPDKVVRLVEHELQLIAQLRYAPYFLTVDDIVRFARDRGILCQGRGSAANSAVCYVLGITAVDPARMDLLFERFVSAERNEPPDIDVDFEHERREEVIQHVYGTYGREHAALAATVIRYRAKSAMREVAKVMGLSTDVQDALSRTVWGYGREGIDEPVLREAGLDPADPALRQAISLAQELLGFPRHLSQHVGGFVIARSPLHHLVPIENAAMVDRTVVEWDKDDLDALKMLKIDILALGMLSCIRRAFELLRAHYGIDLDLARTPADDPAVYEMLCAADSIGVFQVESRAQMSMLPRLKPKTFYDLVIEVAIVRPGPIQGDMVHPYLRRREGREVTSFPSKELEAVLGKTLGVPLFQEQAMRIAIVAAGFTPSEADGLRRSMAAFRRRGELDKWHEKLVGGMVARNYDRDFAERCFKQIEGFGYYGFPESHAASFALLVYVSAWLKCHYPDVFCAAILNAQPMGFYAPAQLVRDAVDHGVEMREVDVNYSFWDCVLEPRLRRGPLQTAVRLGFRQIKGLAEAEAVRIVTARLKPYRTVEELKRRAGIDRSTLVVLAEADAFRSLGLDRRQALWAVRALPDAALPLFDHAMDAAGPGSNLPPVEGSDEPWLELPSMTLGEHVIEDYARLRLSLKAHPMAFLRDRVRSEGVITARQLWEVTPGRRITVMGLVLVRQRPGSAKGVIFSTLEDETGFANIVVWPKLFERNRAVIMTARLLAVRGELQREGRVIHVIAERLIDRTPDLRYLRGEAVDPKVVDGAMSRADEFKREPRDLRDAMPEGRNFR
ncbi:MAG: error-prone DNA polymerase [Geminicoccaceae bacterium]